MRWVRIVIFSINILCWRNGFGQTQQGYVKSLGRAYKMGEALSGVSVRVLSQKKTLPFGDVSVRSSHKKRHCLSAMSPFGVPGRTRTVDIQNHKQSIKFSDSPSVYRCLRLYRKSGLRRFCVDFGTRYYF